MRRSLTIPGTFFVACFLALQMFPAFGVAYDGQCSSLADIDTLPPGAWCEVPNSKITDADAEPPTISQDHFKSIQKNSGVAGMVSKWASGDWDTLHHRMWVFGGGHHAYQGNEIYTFDLSTLSWNRHNLPECCGLPECMDCPGTYEMDVLPVGWSSNPASISPAARHTYDGIVYVPTIDKFFMTSGSYSPTDNPYGQTTFVLDIDAAQPWSVNKSSQGQFNAPIFYPCGDYDSVTDRVYIVGKNWLKSWNPSTYEWTAHNENTPYSETNTTCVIDDTRRIMVQFGVNEAGNTHVDYWNLSDLNLGAVTVSTTGDHPPHGGAAPGVEYDPTVDKFVAWAGETSTYQLDWASKIWHEVPANPANQNSPGPLDTTSEVATEGGVFGRFAYVPSKNVYILLNGGTTNMFFYRLSEGGGLPTDFIPPSPPSNLEVQ